jgi:hypothetical protein
MYSEEFEDDREFGQQAFELTISGVGMVAMVDDFQDKLLSGFEAYGYILVSPPGIVFHWQIIRE